MAASRWSARGSSVRARGFPGRRRWPGLASYPAPVRSRGCGDRRGSFAPCRRPSDNRPRRGPGSRDGSSTRRPGARSRRGSGGYRDNPGRAGGLGHNRAGACLWHRCGAAVLPAGCRHPARGAATSSLTEGPRSPAVLHTRRALPRGLPRGDRARPSGRSVPPTGCPRSPMPPSDTTAGERIARQAPIWRVSKTGASPASHRDVPGRRIGSRREPQALFHSLNRFPHSGREVAAMKGIRKSDAGIRRGSDTIRTCCRGTERPPSPPVGRMGRGRPACARIDREIARSRLPSSYRS